MLSYMLPKWEPWKLNFGMLKTNAFGADALVTGIISASPPRTQQVRPCGSLP